MAKKVTVSWGGYLQIDTGGSVYTYQVDFDAPHGLSAQVSEIVVTTEDDGREYATIITKDEEIIWNLHNVLGWRIKK